MLSIDFFPTRRSSDLHGGHASAIFRGVGVEERLEQLNFQRLGNKTGNDFLLIRLIDIVQRSYVLLAGRRRYHRKILLYPRSEEHTSELQSREKLVCRL